MSFAISRAYKADVLWYCISVLPCHDCVEVVRSRALLPGGGVPHVIATQMDRKHRPDNPATGKVVLTIVVLLKEPPVDGETES